MKKLTVLAVAISFLALGLFAGDKKEKPSKKDEAPKKEIPSKKDSNPSKDKSQKDKVKKEKKEKK